MMSHLLSSKLKAAAIHFVLTILVVSACSFAAFALWFLPPIHHATGFVDLVWLVFLTELCVGPLATFVVWRKGKKWLKIDLAVIVLVQMLFLVYGLYAASGSRPAFYVFVIDDFELVTDSAIIGPDLDPDYKVSLSGGARFVSARFSEDPVIRKQQREAEMFDGISLARRAEAYEPIESRTSDLLKGARSLEDLKKYNSNSKVLSEIKRWPRAVGYLPLKGGVKDLIVLIDEEGRVIGIAHLSPW